MSNKPKIEFEENYLTTAAGLSSAIPAFVGMYTQVWGALDNLVDPAVNGFFGAIGIPVTGSWALGPAATLSVAALSFCLASRGCAAVKGYYHVVEPEANAPSAPAPTQG